MTARRHVLQFKVTLAHVRPAVWRRIQVPDSYSFWDLHVAIQDAMGWLDCHLHQFEVVDSELADLAAIGIPDKDAFAGDSIVIPGWEVDVAEYFAEPGAKARYEYDFGDGWEHEVVLEAIVPRVARTRYPRCLDGARACPPEDCGGVPGYAQFLKIIADPSHPEHAALLEWCGGAFDPRAFRAQDVQFDDPRERWQYAYGKG